MKIPILIAATIVTGGIIFSPSQRNIKGTWRVRAAGNNCADQIIRIKPDHGVWKGTTDLPVAGKYDQPLRKIFSIDDSVFIETEIGQQIKVKWTNDSTVAGVIEQGDQRAVVSLIKQQALRE